MSVYTHINQPTLETLLLQYRLGTLINFTGIHAGIENSNYAVNTSQGDFILTLFETQTQIELNCIFDFLLHLNQYNFPCPVPQPCSNGTFLTTIEDKPTAIFNRLPGRSIYSPSLAQCEEIGGYLAKLHLYSKNFIIKKQTSIKLISWQSTFNSIKSKLSKEVSDILNSELRFQLDFTSLDLPKGIIHADLFTDNVLFNQGKVSGIVDFYDASYDYLLFDIAVTVNNWCVENTTINQHKLSALILGYQTIRALTENEKNHLPIFFRLAALRFWISRLNHQLNPKEGLLTLKKDPVIFQNILEYHRTHTLEFINEADI